MPKTFANPTYDTAFKRLFGNVHHADLTKQFLNTILHRSSDNLITDITFVNTEKTPRFHREKKTYIDIQCKDTLGNEFIIEMQSCKEDHFEKRVQYYVAHGLSRQLEATHLYPELKPVIFIGVLGFNLLENSDKKDTSSQVISHHLITNQATGLQDLNLMEFHFIELPKFKKTEDQLETEIDRWLYFFKKAAQLDEIPQSCAQSATIKEAFDIMERANWDRKTWEVYEEERKLQIYFATQDYAEQQRKEAMKLLELELEQAQQKATQAQQKVTQAEQQAMQAEQKATQAEQKATQEKELIAMNAFKNGIDVALIATITGLSIEEILLLEQQHKKS